MENLFSFFNQQPSNVKVWLLVVILLVAVVVVVLVASVPGAAANLMNFLLGLKLLSSK